MVIAFVNLQLTIHYSHKLIDLARRHGRLSVERPLGGAPELEKPARDVAPFDAQSPHDQSVRGEGAHAPEGRARTRKAPRQLRKLRLNSEPARFGHADPADVERCEVKIR